MERTSKYTQRSRVPAVIEESGGVFRDWIEFKQYVHYDKDLEASIIGICYLESGEGMARVRRYLSPEMFYGEFHQVVWRAMCAMFDAGLPIDIFTLRNYMAVNKDEYLISMEAMGQSWDADLMRLSMYVVGSTHLEYWAVLIRDQYIRRKVLELTSMGASKGEAQAMLATIQDKIDAMMQLSLNDDDWKSMDVLLIKLYQHMMEVEGRDIIGLPTGFQYLDKKISGITDGLYYIGARPSVGKTAFAAKMILNQAMQDIPVGLISLETTGTKLAGRLLSMTSGVDFWKIYRNKMLEETARKVHMYAGALSGLPIYISDQPAVTAADIRAKTMKLLKKGAKAIYIDYIQLVVPGEGAGTREQEVAKLSRGLKLLSMQTKIPIIALAQLSRESERRTDKTPRLIDLRESGSIEQDADGVMLLHRPEKVGQENDEVGNSLKGKAELILAKWRDGETFTHPMLFNGDRMEFSEDDIAIAEQEGWQSSNQPAQVQYSRTPPHPDQNHTPSQDDTKDFEPF